MPPTQDRPRVAVVGYGFAGRCFHTYLVSLADQLQLSGVVTSRAEARDDIRQRFGVPTYDRFEAVLTDDQVDLVVLATPNHVHAPQAIAALEAGKHVVVDKPMALDRAEADRMIAAARGAGRLLTVFQNRRWDGDYLTVRRLLDDGTLGELLTLELAWTQYGRPRGWRSEAAHGGGKLFDLGAHMIDQALQLVPAPVERVYCRTHTGVWDTDVEDHAHCVLTFANGVDAHIVTSSAARQPRPRWTVQGSRAGLIKTGVDPQERAMIDGDIDAAREAPEHRARLWSDVDGQTAESVVETVPGRWRCFYENVAAALQGREELAVKPESVAAVMSVLDAARQSAASGQAVALEGVSGP